MSIQSVWDRNPGAVKIIEKLASARIGTAGIVEALRKKFPDEKISIPNVRTFCSNHKITILPKVRDGITNGGGPDISGAEPAKIDVEGRIAGLRGKIARLTKANTNLVSRNGELQGIRDLIVSACPPVAPLPMQFKSKKTPRGVDYPVVQLLGDWHVGEVINDAEAGGWGSFDLSVARSRLDRLAEKLLAWVDVLRSGYPIRRLIVLILGDLVSGTIHEELRVTNEFPVPVAACEAGKLTTNVLSAWAPYFNDVDVYFIGVDNHGRLTVKPQFKQGALNSWNVVVSEVATALMREHANVRFHYEIANPALIDIEGSKVLAMHGHVLQSWMGIPWYSMERYRGRKAIAHARRGEEIKLHVCGHFHTPAEIPGWIMNGCLSGTTELDNAKGRFSPPSQKSFLWSRKYGAFNRTDWDLS